MTDVYGCVSFPEVLSGFLIRTHKFKCIFALFAFVFVKQTKWGPYVYLEAFSCM